MTAEERVKTKEEIVKELTEKQRLFCEYYAEDWNAAKAARKAGYSENTAKEIGSENLTKPHIQEYIKYIKENLEESAGISKLLMTKRLRNIATASIKRFNRDWFTLDEFENLSEEDLDCIKKSERKATTKMVFNPDSKKREPEDWEYIKVELHCPLKATEMINKMYGYDAPIKVAGPNQDGSHTINHNQLQGATREELESIKATLENIQQRGK